MNGDQLVQDLIDGARRANASVEIGTINPGDSFKTAGAEQALAVLGLLDTEKTAGLWGTVLKPALGKVWGATGGRVSAIAQEPFKWLGAGIQYGANRFSPQAGKFVGDIGKNMARDAAGYGLFTGGINAALADPGDRLNAFGRGFAAGGLSGVTFRGSINLMQKGLKHGLKDRYTALQTMAKPGYFGGFKRQGGKIPWTQGFQGLGSNIAMGGLPYLAATGLSFMTPSFDPAPAPQRPVYRHPVMPPQRQQSWIPLNAYPHYQGMYRGG